MRISDQTRRRIGVQLTGPSGRRAVGFASCLTAALALAVTAPAPAAVYDPPIGEAPVFSFFDQSLNDRMAVKVNLGSGNLILRATDLSIRGTGVDQTVDRYYNSQFKTTADLGQGWRMGTGRDVYLAVDATTGDVKFQGPSRFSAPFTKRADGTFISPLGFRGILSKNPDGTYTLKFNGSEAKMNWDTTGNLLRSWPDPLRSVRPL